MYRLLLFILIISPLCLFSQDIELKNGSFEGSPYYGGSFHPFPLKDWHSTGHVKFEKTTPPDIHSCVEGDTTFWDNPIRDCHGESYISLVTRSTGTWESVVKKLKAPLMKDQCYTFSINLAQSEKYTSPTIEDLSQPVNFDGLTILRIYGSNKRGNKIQLLAESPPVTHQEWKTYTFKFKSKDKFKRLTLAAYFENPNSERTNGHILIDKASAIKKINCPE